MGLLIQFNFKNFKSFRDEVSLDMSATKISEHTDHVALISNDKFLKVAAIYGANGSGKSNLYEAFKYMRYYVINSFNFGGEDENDKEILYKKPASFLFDKDSINEENTFEVFYVDNSDEKEQVYQYGFSILKDMVVEEWLYSKAKTQKEYKTIFYRDKENNLDLSGIANNKHENIMTSLEKETLVVSLGSKLKVDKLKKVRDWFLKNVTIGFGEPTEDYIRSHTLPENFLGDKNVQKDVIKYINSFDESLQDFEVIEAMSDKDDAKNKSYVINVLHKIINSNDKMPISLKEESGGTLKMFALYPYLKKVLDNGGTLFIDELDSRLHPLLMRNIILTFLNPETNANNAQLIFTTHDVWHFSNDLLRRDEIWLIEKNNDGISSLYSLAEFKDDEGNKVRKDESYAKNYLTGFYGAIPSLKPLNILKGD